MRTRPAALALLLGAGLALLESGAAPSQPAGPRILIGILPVYDLSGEAHGEVFARHLTFMIFEEIRGTEVEPLLLNPGGAYSPLAEELIPEFARAAGVDIVLVSALPRSQRPRSGDWTLEVQSYLVEPRSGLHSEMATNRMPVKKRDLQAGVEVGDFYGRTKPFAKQPLGKVARKLARAIRDKVLVVAPSLVRQGTAPNPGGASGSCSVSFQILYPDKRAASKAYDLVVNGREESLEIRDGKVALMLPSGPVVIQAAVRDVPFKLSVQRWYQANTYLDCGRPERTLVLEIGGGGEAFLRWHP